MCIIMQMYQGFAVSTLLMEINSIFLHSRKLMKLNSTSNVYNSNYFKFNSILLAITMVVFRFILPIYVTYLLMVNRDSIALFPYIIGNIGVCVLFPVNIGLSYRIIISDYLKRKTK